VLVNPENVFEIMRALHRVLVDQPLRDKMKQAGYEQSKCFSWERSAQQILGVYRKIGGVRPSKLQNVATDALSGPSSTHRPGM
jgi:hypothetical protein